MFLLTDGITEAENPNGVNFGDGGLQPLMAGGATLKQVFEELRVFTAGAELEDDCTMVQINYVRAD